ncbi:MAG: hypothetical protein ACRDF4_12030, partial [Rhabdochlamydiaceae bacterium]
MSAHTRQALVGGMLIVVIGVMVVAAVTYLPLVTGTNSSTNPLGSTSISHAYTTTTLPAYATSTQTANSSLGLELELGLDSTVFNPGQSVAMNVTLYNSLSIENKVQAATNWPINGLFLRMIGLMPGRSGLYSGYCTEEDYGPIAMGIAVFRGDLSAADISSANSSQTLQLIEPGVASSCPIASAANVSAYYFQPYSHEYSAPAVCSINPCPFGTSNLFDLSGYWIGNATKGNAVMNQLNPGIYTIAAGDEWGQLVILHFVVTKSVGITTTTTYPQGCDSLGCTTGPTSFTTSCSISAQPTGFYLHVITDDTPEPVKGAILNATTVSRCGTATSSQILVTNSTGWSIISMPPSISEDYSVFFNVQYTNSSTGQTYSKFLQVNPRPQEGTFVTLSFPSGTVSVAYRPPISCDGGCSYLDIPQVITVAQSEPALTYTIQLYTNNTLA